MKTTIETITEKLGAHLNVTLWTKKGNRLYVNGFGYNTKKCKQSIYIDIDSFRAMCFTDCPSQPSQWCESQSAEVVASLEKYVRYAKMIASSMGRDAQPIEKQIEEIEIQIHNDELDNQPVVGYYTEWREIRVSINRFGKLATRNRQFVIAFSGTKSTAPRGFVELTAAGHALLRSKRNCEEMLEPYATAPDYDSIAERMATVIASN